MIYAIKNILDNKIYYASRSLADVIDFCINFSYSSDLFYIDCF